MAGPNGFIDSIIQTVGGGHVGQGAGYRTQAEQDDLRRRGVTKTVHSSHTVGTPDQPGAIDLGGYDLSPAGAVRAQAKLRANGHPNAVVIYETGGPNQGTGPHHHISLNDGQAASTQGTQPVASRPPNMPATSQDVSQIRPGPAEVAQLNGPSQFEIADPFKMGGDIAQMADVTYARARKADDVLNDVIAQVDGIQANREAALSTTIETKKAVTAEIRGETQQLIQRAQPLFQAREAIAHRQTELAQMNPFRRALHATFDPNFNEKDLEAKDRSYHNELQVLGENYQYNTNLQDTLTKLIDSDFNDQDSAWRLRTENLNQDVTLLSQSFGMAQAIQGAAMKGLEDQTSLIHAQVLARNDTLSKLTPGQVNVALEQARAAPTGFATVNGVPISIAELTQVQRGYQAQSDAIESRQLALEGGRVELAQRYEQQLIDHMTPAQIQSAIQNGGQYQGQQLSISNLNQAYGAITARNEAQAQGIAQSSAPGLMRNQIGAIQNLVTGTTQRMINIFGAVPDEQRNIIATHTAQIQAMTAGFDEANKRGPEVAAAYAAANAPRLAQLYKEQDDAITAAANRWAGGDKDIAAVGNAWMRGQPISSGAATRGLISMARTGVPPGTRLQGPALQAFRAVQAEVTKDSQPQAGVAPQQFLGGPANDKSQKERQQSLEMRVTALVTDVYNNHIMDAVLQNTPAIAKQIGHPFGQVSPDHFMAAIHFGDTESYKRIAPELGIKPEEAPQMFAQGIGGALWAQVKKSKGLTDDDFARVSQRVQAYQNAATLQALDRSSSTPNFRPSQAYANLLGSPQYRQAIGNVVSNEQNRSFGDFLVTSTAGGGFQQGFGDYGDGVRKQYGVQQSEQIQARMKAAPRQGRDAFRYIATGIDGINGRAADTLWAAVMPGLEPAVEAQLKAGAVNGAGVVKDRNQLEFEAMEDFLLHGKSTNPALTEIQRKIRTEWIPAKRAYDQRNAEELTNAVFNDRSGP